MNKVEDGDLLIFGDRPELVTDIGSGFVATLYRGGSFRGETICKGGMAYHGITGLQRRHLVENFYPASPDYWRFDKQLNEAGIPQ